MDLQTLSKLLIDLITVHDRVSLPGLGGFITELAPSVFSDKAMVIHPPFRRVLFRTNESWNDELLENLYADEADLTVEDSKKEIGAFMRELKLELNSKKSIVFPGFGTMRSTDQHDYFFVADKDLSIFPDAYGLEPLNIKILPKRGVVEILTGGKRASMLNQPSRHSEPPVAQHKRSHHKRNGIKVSSVLLIIFLILVVAVALMVIFKDQIRPVWEWLLYSQEERELLRQLIK